MIPDPTSTLHPPGIGMNGKLFQYVPQAIWTRLEIVLYLLRYGGVPIFQKGLCIFELENRLKKCAAHDLFQPLYFKAFFGKCKTYVSPYFQPYFELIPKTRSVAGVLSSQQ